VFAIAEAFHNSVQLVFGRAALYHGLDGFLETFGEDFAPAGKVCPQTLLFGANLITSDEKRDQANADDERGDESQAELHSLPLSVCLGLGELSRLRRKNHIFA
jgi:hypothetical protein